MSTLSPDHQAILRALAYYDVFSYPLTTEEVRRWAAPPSGQSLTMRTVEEYDSTIQALEQGGRLERHSQYLTLPGRSEIVTTRAERQRAGVKKWKRAESTARFLELVPFVRLVAVVNTLAIDNARPESDIDLLIVTAPHHIWITRLIVTGIVSLLGYRRSGGRAATNVANRVCLSFYVTTDGMKMEQLKREADDPHFAFWTAQAVPLLDDQTYEKYRAANSWVTTLLPNAWDWDWKRRLLVPNAGLRGIKQFYEVFFSTPIGLWVENWARQRQLSRFEHDTNSKAKEGNTDVVISEDVLKFHEVDRRLEYRSAFYARLDELGLSR
ncbi:MAG: hypothetical protein HY975_02290 [Candidatus Kerfeldbacteria bacterium]|nr:hypothetical protein [Candidatus Kerfeldbacteria bacterium]